MVSSAEFRNPGQIQTAFRRDVNRVRMVAYERQAQAATGRTILRHDMTPPPSAGPRPQGGGGPARVPFEDRGRALPNERAVPPRERPMETRPRPEEHRAEPGPRDRGLEARPAPGRPVEPRPREERPRGVDERRLDPAPRERGTEAKPRVDRGDRHAEPPKAEEKSHPAPKNEEAPKEHRKE